MKRWLGKSDERKARFTEAIVRDVTSIRHAGDESVSVAFEEIARMDGTEQVFKPDTSGAPRHPRKFFEYYRMPRRRHPRSTTAICLTRDGLCFRFRPFEHIDTISPRPILIIAGEKAHSRYFSENAYKLAAGPNERHIVPGAGHVDLYDCVNLIPQDKLQPFFGQHLV